MFSYFLVKELPVGEVCAAFNVARGMVQALQENAGRFASMVSLFCERLGWHDLEGLVAKFQNRVSFGVRAEIVELTTIQYVKVSILMLLWPLYFGPINYPYMGSMDKLSQYAYLFIF